MSATAVVKSAHAAVLWFEGREAKRQLALYAVMDAVAWMARATCGRLPSLRPVDFLRALDGPLPPW